MREVWASSELCKVSTLYTNQTHGFVGLKKLNTMEGLLFYVEGHPPHTKFYYLGKQSARGRAGTLLCALSRAGGAGLLELVAESPPVVWHELDPAIDE